MPFVAQKGNPWPLRCDDVAEMRAALEAKGVEFFGDTFDTGVCHMARKGQRTVGAAVLLWVPYRDLIQDSAQLLPWTRGSGAVLGPAP